MGKMLLDYARNDVISNSVVVRRFPSDFRQTVGDRLLNPPNRLPRSPKAMVFLPFDGTKFLHHLSRNEQLVLFES